MRAFTSLAGHLLGSHPAINGYFEMHLSYDDASALESQCETYRESEAFKPGSRFLFDKLLHNDYQLRLQRLGLVEPKLLVCLREPEQTIKSIVNLFAGKATDELYASPVEAAAYYVDRVTALAEFCTDNPGKYFYFDAELLQREPGRLLPAISRWLELDPPLSDSYQIFSGTGETGKGDSSQRIRRGSISGDVSDYSVIELPQEQLRQSRAVYDDCRRRIIDQAVDAIVR